MLRITSITLLLVYGVQSESFTTQCFSSKTDHAVSNAHPIAELFRVSVQECLNYCIVSAAKMGDGCMSVSYHREFSTCQLYGHDGEYKGAKVVLANGHDFFLRNNWVGACQDRVVPKKGYQQKPKMYGVGSTSRTDAIPIPTNMDNFAVVAETTTVEAATEKVTADPRIKVLMPYEEDDEVEELYEEPVNPIAFLNPTHSNECSAKEKVSYFILFGYKLSVRQKPAKLNGVDQSSCIMYCSQNINSHGTATPCYSANYDPVNENCHLYGQQEREMSNLAILSENRDFIFADKFCVKTKKDCSAESPFIVYPGKQMHKKIVHSIPGMNSVVACVAACIDHKRCKAVTYKIGLCILHSATPAADFSLLVDGNVKTMVIENGCQLTANTVPSLISSNKLARDDDFVGAEWDEWSPCQFGVGGKRMRVRHRECTDCDDLQVEEC